MLKSKFDSKGVFWAGLLVEIACVTTQSAALIVVVARTSFSRVERAAAYLTVIVDAVLLLLEAYFAGAFLQLAQLTGKFSLTATAVCALVLGLSGLPIFVAKMQGRAVKRFTSRVPGLLMLLPVLPVLPLVLGLVTVFFSPFTAISCLLFMYLVCCLNVLCVSLGLGIVVLKRDDNLSLSFLVISNLYPALLTFVVIAIRSLKCGKKREPSSSEKNETVSAPENNNLFL